MFVHDRLCFFLRRRVFETWKTQTVRQHHLRTFHQTILEHQGMALKNRMIQRWKAFHVQQIRMQKYRTKCIYRLKRRTFAQWSQQTKLSALCKLAAKTRGHESKAEDHSDNCRPKGPPQKLSMHQRTKHFSPQKLAQRAKGHGPSK